MQDTIRLAHGSGGEMTSRLISDIFYNAFGGDAHTANDSAILDIPAGRTAFTTDAFVISPVFFPGGDIGKLAFCGTVNDLAAAGAQPTALAASFILEEGLEVEALRTIATSIGELTRATGIPVVAGDTKVVDKGSADKIFITTTGIGIVPEGLDYHPRNIREGDKIIISGTIGDHGYSIMALREGIDIHSHIISDCQPLHGLVGEVRQFGDIVRAVRDATRGGLGMVLNEWAQQSDKAILIYENMIPMLDEVRGGCAMLGLDPMYLANEGKMVFAAEGERAQDVVQILRANIAGRDATIIGEVVSGKPAVSMETQWGTKRLVPAPRGEILPRIC